MTSAFTPVRAKRRLASRATASIKPVDATQAPALRLPPIAPQSPAGKVKADCCAKSQTSGKPKPKVSSNPWYATASHCIAPRKRRRRTGRWILAGGSYRCNKRSSAKVSSEISSSSSATRAALPSSPLLSQRCLIRSASVRMPSSSATPRSARHSSATSPPPITKAGQSRGSTTRSSASRREAPSVRAASNALSPCWAILRRINR